MPTAFIYVLTSFSTNLLPLKGLIKITRPTGSFTIILAATSILQKNIHTTVISLNFQLLFILSIAVCKTGAHAAQLFLTVYGLFNPIGENTCF
jgi:hypothetical protein